MNWHDVVPQEELWEGEILPATVADKEIFICNVAGVIHAYEDRCPHQENPLSDGKLDGHSLTCKTHQWRFDLKSGCGINPTGARLTAFPVRVEGGVVQVALAETP